MGHSRLMSMYKHIQLRSFTHEIWLRKGLHMLSIENPVISRGSAILEQDFKIRVLNQSAIKDNVHEKARPPKVIQC